MRLCTKFTFLTIVALFFLKYLIALRGDRSQVVKTLDCDSMIAGSNPVVRPKKPAFFGLSLIYSFVENFVCLIIKYDG